MKKITSITILNRPEGLTNSYTYSVINDEGIVTERNKRESYVITDEEELSAVDVLKNKVKNRLK